MSGPLRVSGGSGGVGANTDDMRATADRLDQTNGQIGRIAGHARGAAVSGALLRTTIFSPLSAANAEAQLVQAAAVIGGLTVRLEAAVLVLRTRANLFDLADAGRAAINVVVSMASVPIAIGLVVLVGPERAKQILSAFPQATNLVTGGLAYWAIALGGGRPGLPTTFEGVVGAIQALAGLGGKWQDGPVDVQRATSEEPDIQVGGVHSILDNLGRLEQGLSGPDDQGAIRIIRVDHGDKPATWIVQIPGTDFDGGPTDPNDMGTNLALMSRGNARLLDAVLQAMRDRIPDGAQVMLAGHSQGGIAAMALACDPRAGAYNITDVVTAGSPVSNFRPPDSVHVLSIEHVQDPVPRIDGQGNPDEANWTTVTRDLGDDPKVQADPIEAHLWGPYAETGAAIDADPALAAERERLKAFYGDKAKQMDYIVRRPV